MSDEGRELTGKLGVMFAYAIAHMQTMGVSKEKQGEFKIAHRQLRSLIQQKPEIDEKWIKDKAREIALGGDFGHYMFSHRLKVFKKFITQIIGDARGGQHEKPKG